MNKNNKKRAIYVVCFVLYSALLIKFASNPTSILYAGDKYLARFVENYNNLKQNWYYFKDEKSVIDAATNAMTSSNLKNDRYSQYIESDQSKAYFDQMDSSFVGIGIQYFMNGEYPLVTKVYPNSPASKAKIKVGDTLVKIGGKDIKNMQSDKIKELVVGKPNTKVNITVQRGHKTIETTATRAELDSSIEYRKYGNTGYILINEFSKTTDKEMAKALKYMEKEKVTKLILDLRNNPGGYLDTLERTADLFLPKNKVVLKTKDKDNKMLEYKTTNDDMYSNNMVLLVNKNSASAAEAFTACLNENLNIPVYGETTFGKGIMQNFFEYKDGSYLKYTNAEWLTPKGNSINKKGIKPTHPVKKSAIFDASTYGYDLSKDIKYDSVNNALISYQKALKALGYNCKRFDGYYSDDTKKAIEQFKADNGLSNEKDLSKKVQNKIISNIFIAINNQNNDNVLNEVLK